MNCRNCGGPVDQNDKFCKYCGAKVEHYSYNQQYNSNHITFDKISGNTYVNPGVPYKSKVLAGILALLTSFGIYNFYLGFKKKAVVQLVLSIIGLISSLAASYVLSTYGETVLYLLCYVLYIVFSLTVGIWSFVDAIRLFRGKIKYDGHGNPII